MTIPPSTAGKRTIPAVLEHRYMGVKMQKGGEVRKRGSYLVVSSLRSPDEVLRYSETSLLYNYGRF